MWSLQRFIIFFVYQNLFVDVQGNGCPLSCKCEGPNFKCNSSSLYDILLGIPKHFQRLTLIIDNIHRIHSFAFQKFVHLTYLEIDGKNIRQIDDDAFSKVPNIGLSHFNLLNTQIDKLGAKAMGGLEDVTYLILSKNNHLKIIEEFAFYQMTKLITLDLRSNGIKDLHPNLFVRNINIRYLLLSKNKLSSLQPDIFRSLDNLNYLYLIGNRIESMENIIPTKTLPKLTKLLLSHNSLSEIKQSDFAHLPNLDYLTLASNQIKVIDDNCFFHTKKLETLHLNNNKISGIKANSFKYLKWLKILKLQQNNIELIADDALSIVPFLEVLDLRQNKVKMIIQTTFSMNKRLKELYLGENSIISINPRSFENLLALEFLELNDNNLTEINQEIFHGLHNLRYLNLRANQITEIPYETFSKLSKLKNLNLGFNKIKSLRNRIFDDTTKITILDLQHNEISYIEGDSFKKLVFLQRLYLQNNYLKDVKSSLFESVAGLQYLFLNHNNIAEIPGLTFKNGKIRLKQLDLSYNKLTHLASDMFKNIPMIKDVNLASNRLKSINKTTFKNAKFLQILSLTANKIIQIEEGSFDGLKALKTLSLAKNKLKELPMRIFQNLKALVTLDLNSNNLTTLSQDTFQNLSSLVTLQLAQNTIQEINPLLLEGLVNLKSVSMQGNKMRTLPPTIFKGNTALQHFNVKDQMNCTCYIIQLIMSLKTKSKEANCRYNETYINIVNMSCDKIQQEWYHAIKRPIPHTSYGQIALPELHTLGKQFILTTLFDISVQNDKKHHQLLQIKGRPNSVTSQTHLNISIVTWNKSLTINLPDGTMRNANFTSDPSIWHYLEMKIIKRNETRFLSIVVDDKVTVHEQITRVATLYNVSLHTSLQLRNLSIYSKDCYIENGGCSDLCIYDEITETKKCACRKGLLMANNACYLNEGFHADFFSSIWLYISIAGFVAIIVFTCVVLIHFCRKKRNLKNMKNNSVPSD